MRNIEMKLMIKYQVARPTNSNIGGALVFGK